MDLLKKGNSVNCPIFEKNSQRCVLHCDEPRKQNKNYKGFIKREGIGN